MKEMTTKEVQKLMLDIMKDVHKFCFENGIGYSLSGGTLLGAIRHDGFIPWDDDIDIQLPRPDYDKFIHTYTSSKGYKVISKEIEGTEGVSYTYARVCDVEKTYVDTGTVPWNTEEVGVWIDVLPCDGMPSEKTYAEYHFKKLKKLVLKHYIWGVKKTPISNIKKGNSFLARYHFFCKKLIGLFLFSDPFPELLKERKRFKYEDCDFFIGTPKNGMGEWQPRSNMESFFLHKFEDTEFYVMKGFDANLKGLFGDYMKLPPLEQRKNHDFNHYYWKDNVI